MSNDDRGLTLIEVMIAMVIAFVVFLGLAEGTRVAVLYNVRNDLRDEAVNVGEREVNALRSLPYDNVAALPSSGPAYDCTVQLRRRLATYRVTRTRSALGADLQRLSFEVRCVQDNTIRYAFTTIVRK